MFPHLRKTLLFLPSRCSSSSSSSSSSQIQIRTLLIRFQVREFSPSPFFPSPRCKRVGEDEYKVRVSVLWDFNTCPVPSNVSYLKVPPSIMGAVRTNGFKGPIHIEAYGNVYHLSDINQQTLFLNGVDLHHFPGEKNGSHRYLKDWISMNPPPAHLFLITGNRDPDFVCTVRDLSLNNYKILYACPGRADDYPCSESTTTLEWSSIVKGKYLIGSAETYNKSSTFFSWISNWWTFWKSSTKSDDLTANQDAIHSRKPELVEDSMLAEVDQSVSHCEKPKSSELQQDVSPSRIHELFSIGSFWWDVVESFLFTPQGLGLLSESRSREDLALKLQKHGHPFLRCLTENDILQLVEILIAEKKWLEESPSQAFPFRLTRKQCSSPNPTISDPNPLPDYMTC